VLFRSLGPVAGAFSQLAFGDDANRHAIGEMKRDGKPGEATSNHDRIEVPWFWEGKVHGAGSYPIFSVGILGLTSTKTEAFALGEA